MQMESFEFRWAVRFPVCSKGLNRSRGNKQLSWVEVWDKAFGDDAPPPPKPGWQLAGFASREDAEAYKARYRAQFGPTSLFPWDVG